MVGRVFRRGFEVWRNPVYLMPALCLAATTGLLGRLLALPPTASGLSWHTFEMFAAWLGMAVAIGIVAIWPGATLFSVALGLLRGQPATFVSRWMPAGLFLRLVLVEGAAGIVIFLGFLLFIAPGMFALVVWSQVRGLMVDGRSKFFDALEDSQDLTRGSRGDVFAMALGIFLLGAISFGCAALIRLASGAGPDSWASFVIQLMCSSPVSAFATAAAAAMYLELVAVAAPLAQSDYFLAPANLPS